MKSTVNRQKNSLEGLNSILVLADGRISKFESRLIETMQSGKQKEQKKGEKQSRLRENAGHH